jgi:hypothetical protein
MVKIMKLLFLMVLSMFTSNSVPVYIQTWIRIRNFGLRVSGTRYLHHWLTVQVVQLLPVALLTASSLGRSCNEKKKIKNLSLLVKNNVFKLKKIPKKKTMVVNL